MGSLGAISLGAGGECMSVDVTPAMHVETYAVTVPNLDPNKQYDLSMLYEPLDRCAKTLAQIWEEQMMDIWCPGWRRARAIERYLQEMYPSLFVQRGTPWYRKAWHRVSAWIDHIRGYRFVHEDDLGDYY